MLGRGNRRADGDAVTETGEPGHRVLDADGGGQVAAAGVGAVPVRQGAGELGLGTCDTAHLI